ESDEESEEEDFDEDFDGSEESFILYDSEKNPVAVLERNTLENSDLLELELAEFQKVVSNMLPKINRKWTSDFLKTVQVCFAFEIKKSGLKEENWEHLALIADMLRNESDGIEQSDGGQFTNESGDIILAVPESEEDAGDDQFVEDWCSCSAALRKNSDWEVFKIDNKESFHRFLNGDLE
ncbi:MAG: hypothetical protein Q4G69_04305, partial [Planctomycetia bacterium]|nr:hypothetical protein [Planctomycetia bacterium]